MPRLGRIFVVALLCAAALGAPAMALVAPVTGPPGFSGTYLKEGYDDGSALLLSARAPDVLVNAEAIAIGGGSIPLGTLTFTDGTTSVSLAGLPPTGSYAIQGATLDGGYVWFDLNRLDIVEGFVEPWDPILDVPLPIGASDLQSTSGTSCPTHTPNYPASGHNTWGVALSGGSSGSNGKIVADIRARANDGGSESHVQTPGIYPGGPSGSTFKVTAQFNVKGNWTTRFSSSGGGGSAGYSVTGTVWHRSGSGWQIANTVTMGSSSTSFTGSGSQSGSGSLNAPGAVVFNAIAGDIYYGVLQVTTTATSNAATMTIEAHATETLTSVTWC